MQRLYKVQSSKFKNKELDLTNALLNILVYPNNEYKINWNEEPIEYEFVFFRIQENIKLEIYKYPDQTRISTLAEKILSITGTYHEICIPFWRALRSFETSVSASVLKKIWRRDFPTMELKKLTERIKSELK